jgi:protein quaking
LKSLEQESRCKIFIRGRGSFRDKAKELSKIGQPGFEHLQEPLHILVETDLEKEEGEKAIQIATSIIQKLLVPVVRDF